MSKSKKTIDFKKIEQEVNKDVPLFQIMDEKGKIVNPDYMPDLTDEQLVEMMEILVWGREYDTRVSVLSRQGIIGNLPPTGGQETSQLITQYALEDGDFLLPTYRDVPPLIRHGLPMHQAMLWYMGHIDGFAYDKGFKATAPQVIIGAQIIQAAGVGLGLKENNKENVALTYIGDGGTSQGDFYEGINFAGAYDAPAIFIVQNNGFGISVPSEDQTKAKTLAQKAVAAGIPHLYVDGMDPIATYVATKAAREYAVSGNGPVLLELKTYRYGPHTLSDDPRRYRDEAQVEAWRTKDQLIRMRNYLTEKKLWTEEMEQKVIDDTADAVKVALEKAQAVEPQKISDVLRTMFEVAPQNIQTQIKIYEEKEMK